MKDHLSNEEILRRIKWGGRWHEYSGRHLRERGLIPARIPYLGVEKPKTKGLGKLLARIKNLLRRTH